MEVTLLYSRLCYGVSLVIFNRVSNGPEPNIRKLGASGWNAFSKSCLYSCILQGIALEVLDWNSISHSDHCSTHKLENFRIEANVYTSNSVSTLTFEQMLRGLIECDLDFHWPRGHVTGASKILPSTCGPSYTEGT